MPSASFVGILYAATEEQITNNFSHILIIIYDQHAERLNDRIDVFLRSLH